MRLLIMQNSFVEKLMEFPLKFIEKIHKYEITVDEAKSNQTELGILISKLNNDYNPKIPKKVKEKNNVLKSRKLLDVRKDIIDVFEKIIFPYKSNVFKTKEEESEEKSKKERVKKFVKYTENESNIINYDLIKKHFNFAVPSALVKQLYVTKNRKKKQWVSKCN